LGKGLWDLMERTVVRCAEGHVFSTASFPMQRAERLGPGRLLRCPRCARLRSVVPVPVALEKQWRGSDTAVGAQQYGRRTSGGEAGAS
jgi:formate-dependent nitrite reductase complex subunit NrfF